MSIDRRRDARVRLPVVVVVALGVLGACGCSDGSQRGSDTTVPVTGHRTSTTAVDRSTTTAAPTTTSTPTAPPSTRPLTTVPPSPLLDEVLAAYDAAYADLLAAGAAGAADSLDLGRHIGDPQLSKWREVLRGLVADGFTVRPDPSVTAWRRIESFNSIDASTAEIEVCRVDSQQKIRPDGSGTGADARPYRYIERLERKDGVWKWTQREWVDSERSASDCALPSPS